MKKTKRDPQEALDSKMKLVSTKIQKLLVDNEMALYPFIDRRANADIASVRLISTAEPKPTKTNDKGTDTEEVGGAEDSDTAS